jgi:glycerol-3-phosphate dehydrogenase
VSGLAGLRPLVAAHGQGQTSKLIRDHEVEVDRASGLISILGGKWTTHRLMAEDTIDTVQREMGTPVTICLTKQHPLAGAAGYEEDFSSRLQKEYAFPTDVANHLTSKFGTRALEVALLLQENQEWKERIAPESPAIRAEIVYCIRNEMAETIEDLLARRTGVQMYGWAAALKAAPAVGKLLAREKNWHSAKEAEAVSGYSDRIRGFLRELELGEG